MSIVADTTTGRVEGTSRYDGVAEFLGIPYATAPDGDLRFEAPQPHSPWTGTRSCVEYGASAPQWDQEATIIPESLIDGDSCLNTNVFAPADASNRGANLPTLVYIHGGGFANGCNASPWYHGRSFARDGVVTFAINYRLGVLGFLPIDGAPNNRGVLDALAALEWVRDNAAAFGGNPDDVTIAGQSAGGVICMTLATMPRAAGLFRRVMPMSGAAHGVRTLEEVIPNSALVAEQANVAPTKTGFASLSTERLIEVQTSFRHPKTGTSAIPYGPLVDGELVPTAPRDAVRAGATAGLDLLAGATREEVNMLPGRGSQELTDSMFRLPAARLAEAHKGAFLYDFAWRSPRLGACHCMDVPFVWDVLDARGIRSRAGDSPPQALADEAHGAVVRFIKTGDPGWPAFDPDDRKVMVFDTPSAVEVHTL